MAIHLKIAASLDVLSNELIEELKSDSIQIFDKQWVVTQTDGANNWLRQQLAFRAGIAANLHCCKMNDVLQLLYKWLCPDASTLIDKDRMTWALFTELELNEFRQQFPDIAAYYNNQPARRITLAAEMADLFDQYQVYRHDKIAAWNLGAANEDPDQNWQVYLWKRMKERLGDSYSDRLDVSQRLLKQLDVEETKETLRRRLPSIRFFGLAIVTPYYLELFRKLSEVIEVKFYLLNPAPEHLWMDDVSDKRIAQLRNRPDLLEARCEGNELLVNWGTVLRESFRLLLDNDSYVNQYEVLSTTSETSPASLLQTIQAEIIQNIPNRNRSSIPETYLLDGSFTLSGCFTPVREVEVLYNYLIDTFKEAPELGARDVLVLVADIDSYAPFIKAVFDNAPVPIPYTIADELLASGNTLFTAIREVLSIDAGSFKSEEVLSLLDSPFIRSRFGFSDVAAVRQAVREAGIYFGMGINNTDEPIYEQTEAWMVSWEYGLQKMLYGLCMSGEELYSGGSRPLYPLDTAEGAAMGDRIRLYQFVQTLWRLLQERNTAKTLKNWAAYFGTLMSELILDEAEEHEDMIRFNQLTDSITSMNEITGDQLIDYPTFRQIFLGRLDQERRTNRFSGRGVNFCSMLPMRSVPYQVIAMLGMNFDQFPRQDSALSFSLIGKERRVGDRSIRENDKHLFLETILAAKKKLYMSYISRDVQKGTEMPPSTLIDELLDYIAQQETNPSQFKKAVAVHHPMHVFSERYCIAETRLPSNYLGNMLLKENAITEVNTQSDEPVFDDKILLDDLARFYKNPVKYYFNQRLGIYYENTSEQICGTELFELNNLQQWKIKDELLNTELDLQDFRVRKKKRGELPLASVGILYSEQLQQEAVPFLNQKLELEGGNAASEILIDCFIGSIPVTGQIQVYGNCMIETTLSSSALRAALSGWIRYLALLASTDKPNYEFAFLYKSKKKLPAVMKIRQGEISRDFALELLSKFVLNFKDGRMNLLPFHPNFGYIGFKKSGFTPLTTLQLREEYDRFINGEQSYHRVFTDGGYLKSVIETSDEQDCIFFDPYLTKLNQLLIDLMSPLFDRDPELFS